MIIIIIIVIMRETTVLTHQCIHIIVYAWRHKIIDCTFKAGPD